MYKTIAVPEEIHSKLQKLADEKRKKIGVKIPLYLVIKELLEMHSVFENFTDQEEQDTHQKNLEHVKEEILLFLRKITIHPQKKSWLKALNHDLTMTLATKLGLTIVSVKQALRDPEIIAELEKLGITPIKKIEGVKA